MGSTRFSRLFKGLGISLLLVLAFSGTLKQELVHHRRYHTRREAIADITEYIEIFYNRIRLQARPGFLSPAAYAQRYYSGLVKAG